MVKMSSLSEEAIGIVEGDISVTKFRFKALTEDVGINDYVELRHEGESYVALITNVHRTVDSILCECSLIGLGPRKPLPVGTMVYKVSEENLRKSLGLTTDEKKGIYIGRLIGYGCKVFLPIKGMGRIFIVGKPGSGKSYTVGVIVEEFLKKGIPVVIIDPHGEYSSLKIPNPSSNQEVESKSYVNQVLEFGDPQINPGVDVGLESLRVAEPEDLVVPGQCTIINLRGIVEEEQVALVSEVLDKLFQASITRRIKPFYCFMDEAHRFAGKEKRSTTEFVKRFAQEGRKFGANLVVVTQRPQLLDTTVRGLVGTWIIHRVTDPNDIKIVLESGGLGKKWEDIIQWLDKGEAVVTGEVVEKVPILVKIRARETMHGAPGFNPLDFAEPELKDKISQRIRDTKRRLVSRQRDEQYWDTPPDITPDLPQGFLPMKIDVKMIVDRLSSKCPYLSLELNDYRLEFKPALQYELRAQVSRREPNVNFQSELVGFTPLAEGFNLARTDAYGVSFDELSSTVLLTEPPSKGRYVQPGVDLSERGFKRLLRGLKVNTSMRLAQVVYYHPGLGYASQTSDKKAFIEECRREAKRLVEEKIKQEFDSLQKVLENVREEYKRKKEMLMKYVDELEELTKSVKRLKNELSDARRSSRPNRKIRIMVETREEKIEKLQKRVATLEEELKELKKYEDALLQDWSIKMNSIKEKYLNLEKTAVRSYVIQPTSKELEVALLQLVWVPTFKAIFTVSSGDVKTTMVLSWNAINGKGFYGECVECGKTAETADEFLLCGVCLKPICDEHKHICEKCGKPICSVHSWRCSVCNRILCDSEGRYTCGLCSKPVCGECSRKCAECEASIAYCLVDIVECPHCSLNLCKEHFKEHLTWCDVCGEELCIKSSSLCSVCGKTLCTSCIVKCSKCGKPVCPDHAWTCNVCGRNFCSNEEKHICEICGKPLCADDFVKCQSCGASVGRTRIIKCPSCGREVCENCLVVKRKGLFRNIGCKLCLGD